MSLVNKTISVPVGSKSSRASASTTIRSSDTGAYILDIEFVDVTAITGTCTLAFRLADGTSADRDSSDGVTITGNHVTYTMEPELYQAKGLTCYVQFVNSNLYTPLMIEFGGIEVVPGGAAVPAAEPYPSWAAAMRVIGAYSALTAYAVGNRVTYSGGCYECIVATTAGTLPTDTDYWVLIASKGDTGATGATGPTGATGATGPANVLSIGTVSTVAVGGSATAAINGTAPAQTLDLGLPTGATGAKGDTGDAGTITAGSTNTGITGLVAGDGSKIAVPTAAQVGALPMPDAGGYFAGDDQLATQMQSVGAQLAQKASLIPLATYTHSANLEVAASAVDVDTDTFTAVGHGLANGNTISPVGNWAVIVVSPLYYYVGGMTQRTYTVINKTDNTFQISTDGVNALNLTTNATQDLTKWHFEKLVALTEITGLSGKKLKVVVRGKALDFNTMFVMPNATPAWAAEWFQTGATSLANPGFNFSYQSEIDYYHEMLFDYTTYIRIRHEFILTHGTSVSACVKAKTISEWYSNKYSSAEISSLKFGATYKIANGTVVEVYVI